MAYAFGHLVGAYLAGLLFQKIKKTKLTHIEWTLLLLGGILPDIDFLLDWTIKTNIHRTLTHSLLFAVIIATLTYLITKHAPNFFSKVNTKNTSPKKLTTIITLGILAHILLDSLFSPGTPLFWPNLTHFSIHGITQIAPITTTIPDTLPLLKQSLKLAIVDMAIGTTWIFYLLIKKKIKF